MANAKTLAPQIIELVGGKENIQAATYCMTRLRLTLADSAKVDSAKLKGLDGVLGLVDQSGQLQIILGPGFVIKVAEEVQSLTNLQLGEIQDVKAQIDDKNRTPFKLFLRKLANIFVPLIPAIVACGMIGGLTNVAINQGWIAKTSDIAVLLTVLGGMAISFLGIFVGINTAKEFGGTPVMGGLAGVLLFSPEIAKITLNGQVMAPGRGGIIGVLLVAAFMAVLERQLRKIIPNALDIILVPAITLLIGALATYFALQPLGAWLSDGIVWFFRAMLDWGGPMAGYLLAATFLPVVTTGLYQGLWPIHAELLNTLKENPLFPILAMAGAGQVGAVIAIYLKTKNRKLKKIIGSALPIGILGIGEPLIYGVTLPLVRPFVAACLGAGFGGAVQVYFNVAFVALGVSGLPAVTLVRPGSAVHYLIGLIVAYIGGFIMTWLIGFDDPKNEDEPTI